MTDITKCEGTGCPLKDTCYRYTAPTNEYYQSFFIEVPYDGKECSHHWKNEVRQEPKDKQL